MKEYIVSHEYIDGIYTDEGSTFGLDMQKELIRCRDCEHHREPVNMCDIWHRHTGREGYCHRAKAKSKEQKAKCKGGEEG